MNLEKAIGVIQDLITEFIPLFRAAWTSTVLIGVAMVVLALLLRKNPVRKKSPWIVGSIGVLMIISSGTQLIFSLF